jgi:hypothetical protein
MPSKLEKCAFKTRMKHIGTTKLATLALIGGLPRTMASIQYCRGLRDLLVRESCSSSLWTSTLRTATKKVRWKKKSKMWAAAAKAQNDCSGGYKILDRSQRMARYWAEDATAKCPTSPRALAMRLMADASW